MSDFEFEEVTEKEFFDFIRDYPSKKLESSIYRINDPEQRHYCDWSLGVWPEAVVAFYDLYGHGDSGPHSPGPGKWKVKKE